MRVLSHTICLGISLSLLTTLACTDDGGNTTSSADSTSSGDGDGDGDSTATGDGDGDGDSTATGDGDGDSTTTGDGDGDSTTTGDGDGDSTTGDGDGDSGGEPCSMGMPCSDAEFCDYEGGACGAFGELGSCRPRPEGCDAGGIGACGCEGGIGTNPCEQHAQGEDDFAYGGCSLFEPGTFACGDTDCDTATELCSIAFNDVPGPDEPEYFANCEPLPEGCAQGDCACINTDFATCYAGTGNTVLFYPGG